MHPPVPIVPSRLGQEKPALTEIFCTFSPGKFPLHICREVCIIHLLKACLLSTFIEGCFINRGRFQSMRLFIRSATVSNAMASTTGTARTATQGSCHLPFGSITTSLPLASIETTCFISVGVGLKYTLKFTGIPLDMPPCMPQVIIAETHLVQFLI